MLKVKSNQIHHLVLDHSQRYGDSIFLREEVLSLRQIQSMSDAEHILCYTCRMCKIGHQEFELGPSLSSCSYF